tara:strand:- start:722 stop:3418 length:2697 start_codon:yes stop_codon:yes gene_type:complete
MESCSDPEVVEAAGSYGSTGTVINQKIVLSTTVDFDFLQNLYPATPPASSDDVLNSWIDFMKRGIDIPYGLEYEPVIVAESSDQPGFFFDHYHIAANPFSPKELEEKSPSGKAFYAKYTTFYNERARGIEAQKNQIEQIINSERKIQNSLPSVYSFMRMLENKDIIEGGMFDISSLRQHIQYYYDKSEDAVQQLYIDLLNTYPFLTHLYLYGQIGKDTNIIEKILSLSFDKHDADQMFSDYYREYAEQLTKDSKFSFSSVKNWWETGDSEIIDNDTPAHLLRALENIMTNIVFSPKSLKLLNKADQYKKHFPSYCELEFTADLFTQIGDIMKKFHLTKPISDVILSSLKPPSADRWYDSFVGSEVLETGVGIWTPFDFISDHTFVDYYQEEVFNSISKSKLPIAQSGEIIATVKKTIDLPLVLEIFNWESVLEKEGVFSGEQAPTSEFSEGDLRNYTSYFSDDFDSKIDLNSDKNAIFKKLFFNAFNAKILDAYNTHRRDFQQILNGEPCYTEDLFYRIEKIKILGDDEEVIQNILIPNTSELDIVKYVDTQVKYSNETSDNIKYKYNVYTHRIVFGSKYRYAWKTEEDNKFLGGFAKRDVDPDTPYDYSTELGYGMTSDLQEASSPGATKKEKEGKAGWSWGAKTVYEKMDLTAAVDVEVHPSVRLVQDLLFSTEEIIILDKPPVPPDVEIVPYRAINNRIKILMSGGTDRFRDVPVEILGTDEAEFQKIKEAQLSTDGKIEFGSDDPVRTFQIFRTTQRPSSYSDFTLHDQITQGFFEETNIFPNTKYYYTFRAIDDHGHISNPTAAYEVELIDEKGAVRPIIRAIDMKPKTNKLPAKECQKYIYLKPKLKQLHLLDQLGDNSIFSDLNNKKIFKMRLTSKGSGKKIDINFSFKRK